MRFRGDKVPVEGSFFLLEAGEDKKPTLERTIQSLNLFWANIILDPTLLYRMQQQDYQVRVWTVNNPYLMRLLLWLGVDAITTDRVNLWQFP